MNQHWRSANNICCSLTLDLTTNSYSILIIIDVSFVLMCVVTIITGFTIVFSTLWFTPTYVSHYLHCCILMSSFTEWSTNMDYLIKASYKSIKLYSSGQYHVLCLSNRSMKRSLKYIVAIGEGGWRLVYEVPHRSHKLNCISWLAIENGATIQRHCWWFVVTTMLKDVPFNQTLRF